MMIKQRFTLDNWNWDVRVYYAVHGYYVDEIVSRLMDMGISQKKLKKAERLLTSVELNTGLTFVKHRRCCCRCTTRIIKMNAHIAIIGDWP